MRGLHSMVNPIPDGCLMLPLLEPACGLRVRVKASLLSWSSSWPTLLRRSLLNGVTLAPSRGSVGSLECCGHFLLPAPPPSEAEREGVAGISSLGDTEMLMGEGADGAPLMPANAPRPLDRLLFQGADHQNKAKKPKSRYTCAV